MTSLLAVVAFAVAISPTADAQQRRAYGRGSVVADGERFQAERLVLLGDTLTFVIRGSGQSKSYPLSRIEYASRVRTHAREGALIGGGLMLLGALLGLAQAGAGPALEPRDNAAAIAAALTAGGVIVGGLIGSALTDEKCIIQNGRVMADLGVRVQRAHSSGSSGRVLIRANLHF